MFDDAYKGRKLQPAGWLMPLLVIAVIALSTTAVLFRLQLQDVRMKEKAHRLSDQASAALVEGRLRGEIGDLKKAAIEREAEFAAQSEDLRQREAAIAGREDAATERTQSSFQGLLIQQQLTKNLEALKASLPDMAPEVEKLAKEHAQLGAERQRLEKEIADLRRRMGQPDSSVVR